MRFLVDESLSARVAELMVAAGHNAVHVADHHLLGAADTSIMAAARDHERIVVSADTDFGEIACARRHPGPAVKVGMTQANYPKFSDWHRMRLLLG